MQQTEQRWLIALYEPVCLFSLRMSNTTSKGGKTLVVPTPYAVKMALIDACFRAEDGPAAEELGRRVYELVKSRTFRFRPPPQCVVQNTFVKVLDAERDGDLPFKQTIVYREFAAFSGGPLEIAADCSGLTDKECTLLERLFWHIHSLGKRGSFWQCSEVRQQDLLPAGYTAPLRSAAFSQPTLYGLTQTLDDFGAELCEARDGFERISTYGDKPMNLGKHRVLETTAIPYRRRSAGKRFTWYERNEAATGNTATEP